MKTFLFDQHHAMGARFVNFAGFEMPLNYTTIKDEHQAVREGVGIFDISHMGRVFVEGLEASHFLDYIATNCVKDMPVNKAVYTVLCDLNGGSIDDVIIYRHQRNHFSLVVNASNREKDLDYLKQHAKNFDVSITPHFKKEGILAIQGPLSKQLLRPFFEEVDDLRFMRSCSLQWGGHALFISRTGYTGELGYEVYGRQEALKELWTELFSQKKIDLKPIGLAARDILRLEMGYVLYGHELTETIAPSESLAFWTIKWDKDDFLGKEAMLQLKKSEKKRSQHGVMLQENAIARPDMEVKINGVLKGSVTSGTFSPSLQKSIAIVMIEGKIKPKDRLTIQIRNREIKAEVVGFPFYKKKEEKK